MADGERPFALGVFSPAVDGEKLPRHEFGLIIPGPGRQQGRSSSHRGSEEDGEAPAGMEGERHFRLDVLEEADLTASVDHHVETKNALRWNLHHVFSVMTDENL